MLIAEDPRILFVHIQKTAGKSITQLLQEKVPGIRPFLGTHDHARWAKAELGDRYTQYFKFAFVRNPWDRLVSWYAMIQQQGSAIPKERLIQLNRTWAYVLENASNFEEFLLNCTGTIDDQDGRKSFLYNQIDYLTDEEGQVIVNFVGRYELLAEDTGIVMEAIGFPNCTIPHVNRSDHKHYSAYYTPALRDLVGERYQRDIEYFSYAFESVESGGI